MKTYEDGLNEAWEVVRRLKNELTSYERIELFGYYSPYDIIDTCTPQEVMKRLEKYDRIEVGDEVTDSSGWKGVVTWTSPDGEYIVIVLDDGSAGRWKKEGFKKTGRRFSQIEEVLKQLKESEGE